MTRHIDIDRDAFESLGSILTRDVLPEARRRMAADWVAHAQGNRRRAHDYRRWAVEAEQAGNLAQYRHYRRQSDRSWRAAWKALDEARLCRELSQLGGN